MRAVHLRCCHACASSDAQWCTSRTASDPHASPLARTVWPLVLALLLVLSWVAPEKARADLRADALVLRSFVRAVKSEISLGWTNTSEVCWWVGIGCDGENVVSIRLPGSGLVGAIPDNTLGNLTFLNTLSLRSNRLSGVFPFSDLARCARLRVLVVSGNALSGSLPLNISGIWPALQRFDVSFNRFGGPIPASFSGLPRLTYLLLQNNSFSGPFPPLNITSLMNFTVAYNNLSGPIPPSLIRWPRESFVGNNLCGPPLESDCPPPPPLPSPPPPPPLLPTTLPPITPTGLVPTGQKLTGIQIASIAIGCALALIVLMGYLITCVGSPRNRRVAKVAATKSNASTNDDDYDCTTSFNPPSETSATVADIQSKADKLVILRGRHFEIEDLLRASAEVLGKGSVGTAYKAKLGDLDGHARLFLVKRASLAVAPDAVHGIMDTIDQTQHNNILPLLAYQFSGRSMLLIYDYMELGSLDTLLHGYNGSVRVPLKWDARYNIALNVAKGIQFIHKNGTEETRFKYTHGNIKSSNVLLKDWDLIYISDFGLTQLVAATTGSSSNMLGYKAPEVKELRKITPMADVYSFGVLLLEILTRKSPKHAIKSGGLDQPGILQAHMQEGMAYKLLDNELTAGANEVQFQEMKQMLNIALECATFTPDERPKMDEVVNKIQDIRTLKWPSTQKSMEPLKWPSTQKSMEPLATLAYTSIL